MYIVKEAPESISQWFPKPYVTPDQVLLRIIKFVVAYGSGQSSDGLVHALKLVPDVGYELLFSVRYHTTWDFPVE